MNVSLTEDKNYIKSIKELIRKTKKYYLSQTKQMLWEITKIKIREYTISYSKEKQKN